jgi:hypothetical protein
MTETFNAVVVSREDFEYLEAYNNATPEQKDMIWDIAQSKLGDMLMQDDRYSDCLEYCINFGKSLFNIRDRYSGD